MNRIFFFWSGTSRFNSILDVKSQFVVITRNLIAVTQKYNAGLPIHFLHSSVNTNLIL